MVRSRIRKLLELALWLGTLGLGLFALCVLFLVVDGYQAFGRMARGKRLARMEQSPEWRSGTFQNPQSLYNDYGRMLSGAWGKSDDSAPKGALHVSRTPTIDSPPATGLRVTWLGHSTLLIEID